MTTMTSEIKTQSEPAEEDIPTKDVSDASGFALPSPDDLPDADVVVFDGKCVFCRKSVKLLQAWVNKGQLAYISLHDPWVAEHVPDLSHEQLMDQMWLLSRVDNSKHGGAEAIRYLSTRSWKLWLAAPFLHFPFSMPLWQWMYQQVAKRRYKIANKNGEPCDENGTCKIHFDK